MTEHIDVCKKGTKWAFFEHEQLTKQLTNQLTN